MANNPNPEVIQEIMFEEQGTRVLITDPAADYYLDEHKRKKLKEKYNEDWFVEDDGN